jgi:hypothetical protein
MGMTSGTTSSLHLGCIVSGLILQKRAKVGCNLCFEAMVQRDLCSRMGIGFGISIAVGSHPQQCPTNLGNLSDFSHNV